MSSVSKHFSKILVSALVAGSSAIFMAQPAQAAEIVDVTMPAELSPQAQWGAMAFAQNCAACHGQNGSGTEQGPPLIHDIYNPGHHGDDAFLSAISSGTRQHHWPYGDMPAQSQVDGKVAKLIIKFIREVQLENGIVYKPHRM